ncbi:hypothetical protein GF354_04825 [Candidatus Peregrinibacteria bacterium]|nr:hypothetical protein [Candidatus Peregrinibacteria bacterium]
MKKTLFITVFTVFFALFASACSLGKDKAENKPAEALLPQNPLMIMAVDYSNKDQRKLLHNLIKTFPETNIKQVISEEMAKNSETLTYENLIAPYVSDDWKLLFAMKIPENVEKIDQDAEIYVAGKFEKADAFEGSMKTALNDEYGEAILEEKKGAFTYWTNADDDLYIGRYGDVFWLTNSEANRDKAVKRLTDGGGFELKKELPDNLAYMYANYGDLVELIKAIEEMEENFEMADVGLMNAYLTGFGELYMYVQAEDKGIRTISDFEVKESSFFDELYEGKDLSLVSKVPANGTMMYFEDVSFKQSVSMFGMSMQSAYLDASKEPELNVSAEEIAEKFNEDFYEPLLETLAQSSSLSAAQIDAKLDSPFAFGIYDTGQLVPGVVFYLDVTDSEGLTEIVDDFVDGVVKGMAQNLGGSMFSADLIQRDIAVIDGTPLKKIYIDYSKLPEGTLDDFSTMVGTNLSAQKVELYYGPTNDDVFVIAFYPEFNDIYGEDVLEENADYKAAISSLNGLGANLVYLDTAPILTYADTLFTFNEQLNAVTDEQKESFEKFKRWMGNIDYVVSSNKFLDGKLEAEMFMRIGK